ncbi:surfeit locus protein 6-like [Tropilaelaps mercedesae]|uniref:Surfeit locus protein 6-like n=1 Tax=Tropilaelaps mercedesae TaxID=418985 RepID=A0A1V9XQN0_9ACAR|nr:surfeit locus protein 6-like [Tropilaelaps mercedesae]
MCTTSEETNPPAVEEGTALADMRRDDEFFCSLVDSIPPRYYFDQDTAKEIREKLQQTTDDAVGGTKRGGRHKVSQAAKHKYAKLNPQIHKSVMQILNEIGENERGLSRQRHKKIKKDRLNLLAKQGGTLHSAALDRASSIEALQETLRAKVEKMKNGRDLDRIRARREFQKLKQQINKKGTGNQIKHGRPAADEVEKNLPNSSDITKPGFNAEGKMVFSKFDFSNTAKADTPIAPHNHALKKLTNVKGLKGYKKQLEFVEGKQRKLEELKQSDPERAAAVEEKSMWLDAIDRSKGFKKKDNAQLLKKTIKKREKMKDRSKKKWAARQETVRKQQDDKQAKRKANLQARRDAKASNKLKKMSKKGRVLHVPGF